MCFLLCMSPFARKLLRAELISESRWSFFRELCYLHKRSNQNNGQNRNKNKYFWRSHFEQLLISVNPNRLSDSSNQRNTKRNEGIRQCCQPEIEGGRFITRVVEIKQDHFRKIVENCVYLKNLTYFYQIWLPKGQSSASDRVYNNSLFSKVENIAQERNLWASRRSWSWSEDIQEK